MKKNTTFLAAVLLTATLFAQSPEAISYQAVVRNSSDQLVTNTQVGMQISILQGSADGTPVYAETQTPTTNANGLVTIEIGGGAGFNTIDWSNGTYFIKTETDPSGGTDYTITGTSQLLSVPYALHSKTVESITEADPVFGSSVAVGITGTDTTNWNNKLDSVTETQTLADVISNNNSANGKIRDVTDPTDAQDAVNKSYVDLLFARIEVLEDELFHDEITDSRDGKVYDVVKIGNQWWMAENINTGTIIARPGFQTDNSVIEKYCYENEEDSCSKYGGLYIWGEAMNYDISEGSTGICPDGWHLPSDEEWKDLELYLGMSIEEIEADNIYRGDKASAIKANGETGFNGLYSGKSYNMGTWYQDVNTLTYWWSSTETAAAGWAWIRGISTNETGIIRANAEAGALTPPYGDFAIPCRCVKD